MPQRRPWFVSTLMAACALNAAACSGTEPEASVQLRIHNAGTLAFEHVWQGSPIAGTDFDFGPLAPGELSAWHAVPAHPQHYRKTGIQFAGGGQRIHVIDPAEHIGQEALAPGRYTYRYAYDGDELKFQLIPERIE